MGCFGYPFQIGEAECSLEETCQSSNVAVMVLGPLAGLSKSMKLFKEENAKKSALRRGVAVTGFIEDISKSWTGVIFVQADRTLPEEQSFNYYRVVGVAVQAE